MKILKHFRTRKIHDVSGPISPLKMMTYETFKMVKYSSERQQQSPVTLIDNCLRQALVSAFVK